MDRRAAGALLALAACIACSTAAPMASSNQTALDVYDGASEGCYYNFQHYGEGDRIMTNEPCLNCTCHNRMLMCYLRVCPFTKPIGQDCTVEKRADQCCPIVTCPDVPVDLLTSTSTSSPAEYGATGVGKPDKYGCSINGRYFPEGSKVPPSPNKPCEHCYCIRNMTTCVMQECTLHVDGCVPIYHKDVCCPVRYSCDHPEDEIPLLDDMTTTVRPTPGFLLTTTTLTPVTQASQDCMHDDQIFADGALIKTEKACEHCYCMKGDIVCVVQECGTPMENEGKNCTSLPPRQGQCCPDTYICEGDELITDQYSEVTTEASVATTHPPRKGVEGSGYRKETDESYTDMPIFDITEPEGSGEDQPTLSNEPEILTPEKPTPDLEDEMFLTTAKESDLKPHSSTAEPSLDETKVPKSEESAEQPSPDYEHEIATESSKQDIDGEEETLKKEDEAVPGRETEIADNIKEIQEPLLTTTMSDSYDVSSSSDGLTSREDQSVITTESSFRKEDFIPSVTDKTSQVELNELTTQGIFNDATTQETFKEATTHETFKEVTTQETFKEATTQETFKEAITHETFKEATTQETFKEVTTQETFKEATTRGILIEAVTQGSLNEVSTEATSKDVTEKELFEPNEPVTLFEDTATLGTQTHDNDALITTEASGKGEVTFNEKEISYDYGTSSTFKSELTETTTLNPIENEIDEDSHDFAGRIPGEGDCLLNGITYRNYTTVPSTNKCHTQCRCVSSIVKCDPIICSPPPEYANINKCQPIYDSVDSCCPTYICDQSKDTILPESHSQMSGTESSRPIYGSECIGDGCKLIEEGETIVPAPGVSDCGSEGCDANIGSPPVQTAECKDGKCHQDINKDLPCDASTGCQVSPVKPCEGDDCTSQHHLDETVEQVSANERECDNDSCRRKETAQDSQEPSTICNGDQCGYPAATDDDHRPFIPEVTTTIIEKDVSATISPDYSIIKPDEELTSNTKEQTPYETSSIKIENDMEEHTTKYEEYHPEATDASVIPGAELLTSIEPKDEVDVNEISTEHSPRKEISTTVPATSEEKEYLTTTSHSLLTEPTIAEENIETQKTEEELLNEKKLTTEASVPSLAPHEITIVETDKMTTPSVPITSSSQEYTLQDNEKETVMFDVSKTTPVKDDKKFLQEPDATESTVVKDITDKELIDKDLTTLSPILIEDSDYATEAPISKVEDTTSNTIEEIVTKFEEEPSVEENLTERIMDNIYTTQKNLETAKPHEVPSDTSIVDKTADDTKIPLTSTELVESISTESSVVDAMEEKVTQQIGDASVTGLDEIKSVTTEAVPSDTEQYMTSKLPDLEVPEDVLGTKEPALEEPITDMPVGEDKLADKTYQTTDLVDQMESLNGRVTEPQKVDVETESPAEVEHSSETDIYYTTTSEGIETAKTQTELAGPSTEKTLGTSQKTIIEDIVTKLPLKDEEEVIKLDADSQIITTEPSRRAEVAPETSQAIDENVENIIPTDIMKEFTTELPSSSDHVKDTIEEKDTEPQEVTQQSEPHMSTELPVSDVNDKETDTTEEKDTEMPTELPIADLHVKDEDTIEEKDTETQEVTQKSEPHMSTELPLSDLKDKDKDITEEKDTEPQEVTQKSEPHMSTELPLSDLKDKDKDTTEEKDTEPQEVTQKTEPFISTASITNVDRVTEPIIDTQKLTTPDLNISENEEHTTSKFVGEGHEIEISTSKVYPNIGDETETSTKDLSDVTKQTEGVETSEDDDVKISTVHPIDVFTTSQDDSSVSRTTLLPETSENILQTSTTKQDKDSETGSYGVDQTSELDKSEEAFTPKQDVTTSAEVVSDTDDKRESTVAPHIMEGESNPHDVTSEADLGAEKETTDKATTISQTEEEMVSGYPEKEAAIPSQGLGLEVGDILPTTEIPVVETSKEQQFTIGHSITTDAQDEEKYPGKLDNPTTEITEIFPEKDVTSTQLKDKSSETPVFITPTDQMDVTEIITGVQETSKTTYRPDLGTTDYVTTEKAEITKIPESHVNVDESTMKIKDIALTEAYMTDLTESPESFTKVDYKEEELLEDKLTTAKITEDHKQTLDEEFMTESPDLSVKVTSDELVTKDLIADIQEETATPELELPKMSTEATNLGEQSKYTKLPEEGVHEGVSSEDKNELTEISIHKVTETPITPSLDTVTETVPVFVDVKDHEKTTVAEKEQIEDLLTSSSPDVVTESIKEEIDDNRKATDLSKVTDAPLPKVTDTLEEVTKLLDQETPEKSTGEPQAESASLDRNLDKETTISSEIFVPVETTSQLPEDESAKKDIMFTTEKFTEQSTEIFEHSSKKPAEMEDQKLVTDLYEVSPTSTSHDGLSVSDVPVNTETVATVDADKTHGGDVTQDEDKLVSDVSTSSIQPNEEDLLKDSSPKTELEGVTQASLDSAVGSETYTKAESTTEKEQFDLDTVSKDEDKVTSSYIDEQHIQPEEVLTDLHKPSTEASEDDIAKTEISVIPIQQTKEEKESTDVPQSFTTERDETETEMSVTLSSEKHPIVPEVVQMIDDQIKETKAPELQTELPTSMSHTAQKETTDKESYPTEIPVSITTTSDEYSLVTHKTYDEATSHPKEPDFIATEGIKIPTKLDLEGSTEATKEQVQLDTKPADETSKFTEYETTRPSDEFSESTPYFVELEEHTHKSIEQVTPEVHQEEGQSTITLEGQQVDKEEYDVTTEKKVVYDLGYQTEEIPKETEVAADEEKQVSTTASSQDDLDKFYSTESPQEKSTEHPIEFEKHTTPHDVHIESETEVTKHAPASYDKETSTPESIESTVSYEKQEPPKHEEQSTSITDLEKEIAVATDKPLEAASPERETTAPEEEFIPAVTKTTTKSAEDITTLPPIHFDNFTGSEDKPAEVTPSTSPPELPKPGFNDVLPTDDIPSTDADSHFPPTGTSGYGQEPDYGEEDQVLEPGTCRYGGKTYLSAQQIPRDDPCDFCFCFRSDIICLQQSCPPPIHGCHEEPIQGFCCPRYECPVSMATTLNITTTTTTTTTTLPPHFLPHAYKGAAQRRGCQIKGHSYKVGEVVRASSGPCLHCTCGGDGQMKCDPKACTPEPMLRHMIAAAVSAKRRR